MKPLDGIPNVDIEFQFLCTCFGREVQILYIDALDFGRYVGPDINGSPIRGCGQHSEF